MLIGTGDVRDWVKIPDGDKLPNPKLLNLCRSVQDFCDSYTHRKLEAARYNSDPNFTFYDGTGRRWIYTAQYPISNVVAVYVDSERVFGASTAIDSGDIFFYPDGKVVSEGEYFIRGRRNVKIDYIAGYAPIVGGTHSAVVSSYPLPYDLRQTMIEMVAEAYKEGVTAIHTVAGQEDTKIVRMFSANSAWKMTLGRYTKMDFGLGARDE